MTNKRQVYSFSLDDAFNAREKVLMYNLKPESLCDDCYAEAEALNNIMEMINANNLKEQFKIQLCNGEVELRDDAYNEVVQIEGTRFDQSAHELIEELSMFALALAIKVLPETDGVNIMHHAFAIVFEITSFSFEFIVDDASAVNKMS